MNFGYIWPFFLLLLLIPVIILLYLLRQKTEDKTFSSLYLWREAYKNIEAARPWEKFKNNILMYLQIAVILALVFAMAAPYLKTGGVQQSNVILVMDTSASMNMRFDDKNTRLEQARKKGSEYIDSLAEGTAVTILSADANTTILGANITDKIEMKRILTELAGTDLPGNMQGAVAYAASIASQWEDYEVVFFTDTFVSMEKDSSMQENHSMEKDQDSSMGEKHFYEGLNGRVVSVNSHVSNACIDYVSLSQTDQEMVVLAKVTNASELPFSSDINLYVDDVLKDIQSVDLAARESVILYFEGLQRSGEVIWAQINEKDGLAADNVGYVVRETQAGLTALIVTGQNTFLETAASLVEGVEFYKASQAEGSWEEGFDLYIFDGMLPEKLPDKGGLIFIGPPESVPGVLEIDQELENVMISAVSHQVTRYLEGSVFGTVRASSFVPVLGQEAFLKAGDHVIGLCGEYNGRKTAVLGFDFHDTDFPLQTEFPILIHNLISYCLEQGMTRRSVFQTGDMMTIYSEPQGGDVHLRYPDGEERILTMDGRYSYQISLPLSGIYTVSQTVEDTVRTEQVAVRFPTQQESYVAEWEENHSMEEEHSTEENHSGEYAGGTQLRNLFLLLALILLCVEWMVYIRSR